MFSGNIFGDTFNIDVVEQKKIISSKKSIGDIMTPDSQ